MEEARRRRGSCTALRHRRDSATESPLSERGAPMRRFPRRPATTCRILERRAPMRRILERRAPMRRIQYLRAPMWRGPERCALLRGTRHRRGLHARPPRSARRRPAVRRRQSAIRSDEPSAISITSASSAPAAVRHRSSRPVASSTGARADARSYRPCANARPGDARIGSGAARGIANADVLASRGRA